MVLVYGILHIVGLKMDVVELPDPPQRHRALYTVKLGDHSVVICDSVFSLNWKSDKMIQIIWNFNFSFRYGIGTIYSKQERYLLAELHFKRALSINTQSSILLCHIGVVSFLMLDNTFDTVRPNIKCSLFTWIRETMFFTCD